MTRQRALRLAREWAQGHKCTLRDGEAAEYHSMFAAMLEESMPNEPLTLEDLRKIDTVTPLWVHNLSWGQYKPRIMLVRYVASNCWSCVDFDGFEIVKADDYGSRYLIYRRPPEGEEEP